MKDNVISFPKKPIRDVRSINIDNIDRSGFNATYLKDKSLEKIVTCVNDTMKMMVATLDKHGYIIHDPTNMKVYPEIEMINVMLRSLCGRRGEHDYPVRKLIEVLRDKLSENADAYMNSDVLVDVVEAEL